MIIEISLILIGTAIIVKSINRRVNVTDTGTQTEQGLWLPHVPMYLDDSSSSDVSILEMDVIHSYVSAS